jgi:UDP-GlcNAc3NAcA epimerase
MKIVTVVGARPQFIKAAVVSRALSALTGLKEVLVHTGQHYDRAMSDEIFRDLGIRTPDHNLGIGSSSHGAQTGRMLEAIERVLMSERPDCVLVYGDTNSTLSGALAAAKLHIPVAHVEAGMRSFNRAMPEEINRILVDHVADLLFAPTDTAIANLAREGIADDRVRLVGDVMYDAALTFAEKNDGESFLERLGVKRGAFALATIHRAENTDNIGRLQSVLNGLVAAADTIPIVFPLHPRTRHALERAGLLADAETKLNCLAPLGYLEMLAAIRAAAVVITDSGGLQKEAFFLNTPCLIVRNETEWVELLNFGCASLISPQDTVQNLLDLPKNAGKSAAELYGGGKATARIAAALSGVGSEVS